MTDLRKKSHNVGVAVCIKTMGPCCKPVELSPPFSFRSSRRARITRLDESHIVKSGPLEHLRGELHFYRSIPPELSKLFPKLVEGNDNPSLTMPSMTITKVKQTGMSEMQRRDIINY